MADVTMYHDYIAQLKVKSAFLPITVDFGGSNQ
jgi:hypothetical protein